MKTEAFEKGAKKASYYVISISVNKKYALKGPSQPPPFSMPSKLFILHGATKSYCFTVSCVPGSMFDFL